MRNIKEFLDAWFAAKPTKEARNGIATDIWYDWFCSTKGLFARTRKFIGPLHQLIKAIPEAGALTPSGKNCCPISTRFTIASAFLMAISLCATLRLAKAILNIALSWKTMMNTPIAATTTRRWLRH